MENNQRPFYLRAMVGMESIVSEVNGSYARPEKPCNASRVRRTRPEWHILKTRLRYDVGAKAEERLIVGKRQVQSGPTLNTLAKGRTRFKKCWFQRSRCSLTHRKKTRVSTLLSLFFFHFPVDKMNQIS